MPGFRQRSETVAVEPQQASGTTLAMSFRHSSSRVVLRDPRRCSTPWERPRAGPATSTRTSRRGGKYGCFCRLPRRVYRPTQTLEGCCGRAFAFQLGQQLVGSGDLEVVARSKIGSLRCGISRRKRAWHGPGNWRSSLCSVVSFTLPSRSTPGLRPASRCPHRAGVRQEAQAWPPRPPPRLPAGAQRQGRSPQAG